MNKNGNGRRIIGKICQTIGRLRKEHYRVSIKNTATNGDIHLSILYACRKANERLRLIELRNMINAHRTAIVVFCLESASMSCGTPFDHSDDALKLTGLSKKEYSRQKKTFDKLLGLNRQLQLKDICLGLDLPQSIHVNAQRILNAYESNRKFTDDTRSAHCIAMAVYQCCKQQKIKSVKSKLRDMSNLSKDQWNRLDEQWRKWMASAEPLKQKLSLDPKAGIDVIVNASHVSYDQANRVAIIQRTVEEKTQSYEEWKAAMIDQAMDELKKQNHTSHDEIEVH